MGPPDDLLLVYPFSNFFSGEAWPLTFRHGLGPTYVALHLRQHGLGASTFRRPGHWSARSAAEEIVAQRPRSVGFSVFQTNLVTCRLLGSLVRQMAPDTVIVLGGPLATVQPEKLLASWPWADLCVVGYGEETALELVTELSRSGFDPRRADLARIPGLCLRTADAIQRTAPRLLPHVDDPSHAVLDRYPSPYLTGYFTDATEGLITARGCNQFCTYCNCAVLSGWKIHLHSVDRVVDEIEAALRLMTDGQVLDVWDDAFTLLPARAEAICREIIRRGVRVRLNTSTRCDRVDRPLLKLMREAGIEFLGFALESAVPHVLRRIGKVQPPSVSGDPGFEKESAFVQRFLEAVDEARDAGMTAYAYYMYGLPGETPAEAQETIDLIRRSSVGFSAGSILLLCPGTVAYEQRGQLGPTATVGHDGLQLRMVYHYDVTALELPQNSTLIKGWTKQEAVLPGIFSLAVSDEDVAIRGLKAAILLVDELDDELVSGLRSCLAVNAAIVIVCGTLEAVAERYRSNTGKVLYELPTGAVFHYHREQTGDHLQVLRRYMDLAWALKYFEPIWLASGPEALSLGLPFRRTVCFDRDVRSSFDLVDRVSGGRSAHGAPSSRRVFFPRLASFCMWGGPLANCHAVGSIILDADRSVRLCWGAQPVTRGLGEWADLRKAAAEQLRRVRLARGCDSCPVGGECSCCAAVPEEDAPLYCSLRRERAAQTALAWRWYTRWQSLLRDL